MSIKDLALTYPLLVLYEHGHIYISSPDFGFFFAVPHETDRSHWTALTLDQARHEIEKRLIKLAAEGKPAPKPKKQREIVNAAPKDLLSICDVAEMMGCSQDTIRRLAESGDLPCHKTPGGHRKFSRKAVWLYTQKQNVSDASRLTASTSILNPAQALQEF